jgi:hypothetical protein
MAVAWVEFSSLSELELIAYPICRAAMERTQFSGEQIIRISYQAAQSPVFEVAELQGVGELSIYA